MNTLKTVAAKRSYRAAFGVISALTLVCAAFWSPPDTSATDSSVSTPTSQQETTGIQFHPVVVDGSVVSPNSLGSVQKLQAINGDGAVPPGFDSDTPFQVYDSSTLAAPQQFNAVGFHWVGDLPAGADIAFEARSSQDGSEWSDWSGTYTLDALQGDPSARDTDLIFIDGRYLQYRIVVAGAPADWQGSLDAVRVTYIDSTQGPTGDESSSGSLASRLAAVFVRPTILGRNGWGANESIRFNRGDMVWPPTYSQTQKIIIHHTDTSSSTEPTAAIRAIYQYHTVTLGWGDIGYNFVIDSTGRIFEGRYGGANVEAGHAQRYNKGSIGVALLGSYSTATPTTAMTQALQNFLLTKSLQFGIDPNGRGFFIDKDLPNIVAHRDVLPTACPGEVVYAMLADLRATTNANLPAQAAAWLSNSTPGVMEPGAQAAVPLTIRNSGSAAWQNAGDAAVQVTYRWFNADGTAVPGESVKTSLSKPINPKENVSLQGMVKAPATAGRYLLKWDMQQNGWFEDQGSLPLEQWVLVTPFASVSNDFLVQLPNDILAQFPPARIQSLPLSRLTLLSNTDLVVLMPEIIKQFPNERVLSFSNDMLLRYLPDSRLKTFSLDRLRTMAYDVQVRLGVALPPTATTTPAAPTSTPVVTVTPTPADQPSATATPVATATPTATPTPPMVVVGDPGGSAPP